MSINRKYINADEKNVKAVIMYSASNYLYTDPECTKPATKDEVYEAFLRGLFIARDGVTTNSSLCAATSYSDQGDYCVVIIHIGGGDTLDLGTVGAPEPPTFAAGNGDDTETDVSGDGT